MKSSSVAAGHRWPAGEYLDTTLARGADEWEDIELFRVEEEVPGEA